MSCALFIAEGDIARIALDIPVTEGGSYAFEFILEEELQTLSFSFSFVSFTNVDGAAEFDREVDSDTGAFTVDGRGGETLYLTVMATSGSGPFAISRSDVEDSLSLPVLPVLIVLNIAFLFLVVEFYRSRRRLAMFAQFQGAPPNPGEQQMMNVPKYVAPLVTLDLPSAEQWLEDEVGVIHKGWGASPLGKMRMVNHAMAAFLHEEEGMTADDADNSGRHYMYCDADEELDEIISERNGAMGVLGHSSPSTDAVVTGEPGKTGRRRRSSTNAESIFF